MTPWFGKLLILFAERLFRDRLSIYVRASFPFSFDGRMWDLIVDHGRFLFTVLRKKVAFSMCEQKRLMLARAPQV